MWYRDVLYFKATGDVNGLIFKDEVYDIKRQAEKSSYNGINLGSVMTVPISTPLAVSTIACMPAFNCNFPGHEKQVEKNRQKEKEAFKICLEKIAKHKLDMERFCSFAILIDTGANSERNV